jgi:TldD protein
MHSRRDFLRQGGSALGAAALAGSALGGIPRLLSAAPAPGDRALATFTDPAEVRALLMRALDAAKSAGATYADVRISRQRQNFVFTREKQIQNVVDTDSVGIGVRALVDGTWGFAATRLLTPEGASSAAREAVAIARASRVARDKGVEWLPAPAHKDVKWKNAYTIDPWTVPLEQKAELLLKANEEAMKAKNVKFVFSGLFFVKDDRNYANTDGSVISQDVVRSWPTMQITAVSPDFTDFQTAATWPRRWGAAGSTSSRSTSPATPPAGARRPPPSSAPSPSRWGATTSCSTRATCGSPSTRASATPRSSTARWATRPTTPARAS